MSRIRMIVFVSAMLLAAQALTSNLVAQAPGGGRGGPGGPGGGPGGPPGGGRGGPGGFGWGGPGGPGGGSNLSLLANPAVQTDLNLTDKQKSQVDQLQKDMTEQRRQTFDALRKSAEANASAEAAAGGFDPAAAGGAAPGGGGPGGPGGGGPGGPGGGGGGGGRGRGGWSNIDPEAMRSAMTALRTTEETKVAKLLTPKQRTRLKQISLRREGPRAVVREEIAAKLNMSEDQVASVQEIIDQSNQERRQLFQTQRDRMRTLMEAQKAANPTTANNADDEPPTNPNPPRNANGAARGNANAATNTPAGNGGGNNPAAGANGAGGPPGNNGGRGGNNGRFNRQAFQAFMDSPEGKAEREKSQAQQDALEKKTVQLIARVLTRKQTQLFNAMLGEPFDVSQLDWRRNRGNQANGNNANTSSSTTANGAAAKSTAPAAAKASAPAESDTPKTATTSTRKTRNLRGQPKRPAAK